MFVVLDFLVIVTLITMEIASEHFILRERMAVFYQRNNGLDLSHAVYDPFVWVGLIPVEAITLVINAWLALSQCTKNPGQSPKLMKIVLRDNICYLVVWVEIIYMYLFLLTESPCVGCCSSMLSELFLFLRQKQRTSAYL